MLRQCPKCSTWLSAHASRCLACGAHLDSPIPRPTPPAPRPSILLRTWLDARPRTERLILLLTYADELTPDEIAEVLELGRDYVAETLRCARDEAGEILYPRPASPVPRPSPQEPPDAP